MSRGLLGDTRDHIKHISKNLTEVFWVIILNYYKCITIIWLYVSRGLLGDTRDHIKHISKNLTEVFWVILETITSTSVKNVSLIIYKNMYKGLQILSTKISIVYEIMVLK